MSWTSELRQQLCYLVIVTTVYLLKSDSRWNITFYHFFMSVNK